MFTGIIESVGKISELKFEEDKLYVTITSPLSAELKVDQSVAHNGICLTVIEIKENEYTVCAVHETILKTTISLWKIGDPVNLERGMIAGARLDGHIVQGHVDIKGSCEKAQFSNGNWQFVFSYPEAYAALMIEKGSIVINGVSLTCYNLEGYTFSVTIIPYTWENTSFNALKEGDEVNLEFDVIGKYLQRSISLSR